MEKETRKKELVKEKPPIVNGELKILMIPSLVLNVICPHCGCKDWGCVQEDECNKTLLSCCSQCEEDYYVSIPSLP